MIVNEIPVKVLATDWNDVKAKEEVWDVLYISKYLTVDGNGNPYEDERATLVRKGKVLRIPLDDCKIIKTRRVNYGQGITSRPRANFGGKHQGKRDRDKERDNPVERHEDIADTSEGDSSRLRPEREEDGGSTE